jgi:hypothetical protein
MRQFNVIVCKALVTVEELDMPLKKYDISANVDGDEWLYRITKLPMHHLPGGWKERGYSHAFYHAKNNGHHVKFNRVDVVKSSRKRKRHPAQLRLFH